MILCKVQNRYCLRKEDKYSYIRYKFEEEYLLFRNHVLNKDGKVEYQWCH